MSKRQRDRREAGGAKARKPAEADYDSPWKEALDCYLERCIALFFPEAHADIDWARGYEMLDKELRSRSQC